MCNLSTPTVILILLIEVFVIGAFIVMAIAKLKVDNPSKKNEQEAVQFERVPPPWFVDQWIAKNCPPVDTSEDKKDVWWLLALAVFAAGGIIYFTFN